IAEPDAPTVPPAPKALTAGEQRVLSVIVATLAPMPKARPPTQPPTQVLDGAAPPDGWDDAPPPAADEWHRTPPLDAPDDERAPEPTTSPAIVRTEFEDDRQRPLRAVAEVYGGSLEQLADGSLVVTLKGAGAATDQAARAARCALSLRDLLPEVPMAIATGRGMLALRFPVGDVIEHAARLLREVAGAEPARSGGGGAARARASAATP